MTKWNDNRIPQSDCCESMDLMTVETVRKVQNFHKGFPQYASTPLVSLNNLAKELGVKGIYIKDESHRFGLNSFKALGAIFALASFIAKTTGRPVWDLDYTANNLL